MIQFLAVTRTQFDALPLQSGSERLIFVTDTCEFFLEKNNVRKPAAQDLVFLSSESEKPAAPLSKFYYVQATNALYFPQAGSGGDLVWTRVNGSSSGDSSGGSAGHSVFEIFYSLSSTTPPGAMDLSLGTLISSCNTLYPDFWTECVARKNAGTIRCLTESEWQAELTANGSCGAFVVDPSNYSVRLPKIVDYLRSGTDDQLGTYQEEGLPNISGGVTGYLQGASGAFYLTAGWSSGPTTQSQEPYARGLHLDASRSSSIYGKSTHVQPKTVHARLFIQVYTAAVPASTAQAANFVNALEGKVDASQVPAAARNRVWISEAQTITYSTTYQLTHSLNFTDDEIKHARCDVILKCLTAQYGYAAGEWVHPSHMRYISGQYSDAVLAPNIDQNTLNFRTALGIMIMYKTANTVSTVTPANWEMYFRIFY